MEDTLTKLNTQLNRSMVLMDHTMDETLPLRKSAKTIKINTKLLPAISTNSPSTGSRKSILKRSQRSTGNEEARENLPDIESELERLNRENQERLSMSVEPLPVSRPHNLQDLVVSENLIVDSTEPTFNLDDMSDSEEVWIMEIPRTINPLDLTGEILKLGEKAKFKVNNERYCAIKQDVKSNLTCVINSGKGKQQYKTVNVRPKGTIGLRRKLSNYRKIQAMNVENSGVPFPKNLKTRHPLFGANLEGKVKTASTKVFS